MREAVIVAIARTPIGKAYRGAFNNTQAQSLGGHVIATAVERAGIDPAEIADVVVGAALQQGTTGSNVGRQCAMRAGLPTSIAGMSTELSKQHSPTSQHESKHPEQRRHYVDGDEHAKHQRVVEEGRGVAIDRDRRN